MKLSIRNRVDVHLWTIVMVTLSLLCVGANVVQDAQARSVSKFRPERLPLPEGRTADGALVGRDNAAFTSCVVVRYSSESCEFCKRDRPVYRRIEHLARSYGCGSVLIAPALRLYPTNVDPGVIQLAFPSFSFVAAAKFHLTPTTLILDRAGNVLWAREGTVAQIDEVVIEKALVATGLVKRS